MTDTHKIMAKSREREVQSGLNDLLLAFADHYGMSIPSAAYAMQQVSARWLCGMDRHATVKTLRLTADYMSGRLEYDDFFRKTASTFDRIADGHDAKTETKQ